MKLKIEKDDSKIYRVSFFLLFPGFFFYHFSVSIGLFPPFFGGFFGPFSVLTFPVLFYVYIFKNKILLNPVEMIFWSIIIYTIIIAIVNFIFARPINYEEDMFFWSVRGVLFNVVCYLVFRSFNVQSFYSWVLLIALIAMAAIVLYNIGENGIFYAKQNAEENSDAVATYQGFGRSLVVVMLVLTGVFYDKTLIRNVVIFIGIVALYLNGSRSEFVLYVIALSSLFLVKSFFSLKTFFYFITSVFILAFFWYLLFDSLPHSRMSQLLNITESSSFQARKHLIEYGVELIKDSPFFGNYGFYTELGGPGKYPHNIASAWVNLGLIGFLLYLILFALIWYSYLKLLIKKKVNSRSFATLHLFLIFVTLALIGAKNHSYMLTGSLVGIYAFHLNDSKKNISSKKLKR